MSSSAQEYYFEVYLIKILQIMMDNGILLNNAMANFNIPSDSSNDPVRMPSFQAFEFALTFIFT